MYLIVTYNKAYMSYMDDSTYWYKSNKSHAYIYTPYISRSYMNWHEYIAQPNSIIRITNQLVADSTN
jgi:hypothetical protein